MRIAHATDIHWFVPPTLRDLTVKRALGTANLYLRDRKSHFSEVVQDALVAHMMALGPDLVLITGDLTAQALDAEFSKAREALRPVLSSIPTMIVPGNHDLYTPGARRHDRIAKHFEPFLHRHGAIHRFDSDEVCVLGLDPNRPTYLSASGMIPEEQLVDLSEALQDPSLAGRFVVLSLHYPIVDRHNAVYDNASHGLRNAQALLDVLQAAPRRPDMVVHGHRHHGYQAVLPVGDIPSFNSGSSGYAYLPDHGRTAAMNLYTVHDGRLETVERYRFDGTSFELEEGGAYASGG